MAEWTAEVGVDEELAASLVPEQFPPLPERSVRLVSEGWDYAVFAVDETWAFRFPRRAVGVAGTEREIAVLPRIAPYLPVAVPAPDYVGRPSGEFPWPFFGAAFLPGVEAGEAALSDEERIALARPLARALRRLHAPELLAGLGDELPADPMGRGDPRVRVPKTRDQLAAVAEAGIWQAPPEARRPARRERWRCRRRSRPSSATATSTSASSSSRPAELTGMIDWVDVCRGDPGIDLQLYWSFLPPRGRTTFLDEYGPVPEDSLLRARVLALDLNAVLALYGREERQPRIEAEALSGLDRAAHTT